MESHSNVILVGFMGTGKTTVGRALAARLGWRFIDTDSFIEEQEGMSVAEIFAQKGEAYFRQTETRALMQILKRSGQVVATGGGAVLAEENRAMMLQGGLVAALQASPATIIGRVREDKSRPLLAGDVEERVHRLLEARRTAYDFAPVQLATDGISVDQLVERLAERLMAKP